MENGDNNNGIAVNVAVRIRPLLPFEEVNVINYINEENEPPVLIVCDKNNIFAFDHIFPTEAQQGDVYNAIVKPLVSKTVMGYNCTILAYGQTGTGKTYTIGTSYQKSIDEKTGLIPRVLDEFFDLSSDEPDTKISISFMEIYNEKVYDLLGLTKTALLVKGFTVPGIKCVPLNQSQDLWHWLEIGAQNRHVGHTVLNESSSRSHAIFTVYFTRNEAGPVSKLHLVDLAGSESVRRTGHKGQAFQEGVTINRGLLAVTRVINALSNKNNKVIPYRDSILTMILRDSLSINNYVALLACVSPSASNVAETLATLRFAVKAKSLRSKPQLENILSNYSNSHPEFLNRNSCTTVKKPKRRSLATFTQAKRRKKISNGDSFLPLSNSTQIDMLQLPVGLSPLTQCYATILKNKVSERIKTEMKKQSIAISTVSSKNNEENVSPMSIIIQRHLAEIINDEVAQKAEEILKVDTRNSSNVVKKLDFDNGSPTECKNNDFELEPKFKIPNIPARKSRRITINSSVMSKPLRRSMRLISTRNSTIMPLTPASCSSKANYLITDFFPSKEGATPRRSIRLSTKLHPIEQKLSPDKSKKNAIDITTPIASKPWKIKQSPCKNHKILAVIHDNVQKPIKSPHRKHRKIVLNILNSGTQKELLSLMTVGPKTALQILTYRSLNKQFDTIEDMQKIPSWAGKRFERFMVQNQLVNE